MTALPAALLRFIGRLTLTITFTEICKSVGSEISFQCSQKHIPLLTSKGGSKLLARGVASRPWAEGTIRTLKIEKKEEKPFLEGRIAGPG